MIHAGGERHGMVPPDVQYWSLSKCCHLQGCCCCLYALSSSTGKSSFMYLLSSSTNASFFMFSLFSTKHTSFVISADTLVIFNKICKKTENKIHTFPIRLVESCQKKTVPKNLKIFYFKNLVDSGRKEVKVLSSHEQKEKIYLFLKHSVFSYRSTNSALTMAVSVQQKLD